MDDIQIQPQVKKPGAAPEDHKAAQPQMHAADGCTASIVSPKTYLLSDTPHLIYTSKLLLLRLKFRSPLLPPQSLAGEHPLTTPPILRDVCFAIYNFGIS